MNSILGNALSERITDDPANPETAKFSKMYVNNSIAVKEPIRKGKNGNYLIKAEGPLKIKQALPS